MVFSRASGTKVDYYAAKVPYHRCVRQRFQNGPHAGSIFSYRFPGSYSYNSQRGAPGGIPSVASFSTTSKGSDTEKAGEDVLPQSTGEEKEIPDDTLATPTTTIGDRYSR